MTQQEKEKWIAVGRVQECREQWKLAKQAPVFEQYRVISLRRRLQSFVDYLQSLNKVSV